MRTPLVIHYPWDSIPEAYNYCAIDPLGRAYAYTDCPVLETNTFGFYDWMCCTSLETRRCIGAYIQVRGMKKRRTVNGIYPRWTETLRTRPSISQ
jgi:hypothetical protein